MKIAALVLSAFVLPLVPQVASAQTIKIGYVDMQAALNQIEEGKREKNKLKKDFDEKQKKLDAMQEDLKKLKEDFDKQQTVMKEDARLKRQTELQNKFMELQQHYMGMQKELNERQGEVTKEIFSKMKVIIEKIGDRDNYTVIFSRDDSNVLFYKRHQDITDEVVKQYNSQYK